MKKIKFVFVFICIAFIAATVPMVSHAGQDGEEGVPAINIFTEGVPVTITGILADVNGFSLGFVIDTGTEDEPMLETVYGLGPISYWEAQGVPRPEIGESITVYAVEVTFSDGSAKLIATSIDITAEGEYAVSIDLRYEDGLPLWRVMSMKQLNNGSEESAGDFGIGGAGTQEQSKLHDGSCQGESSGGLGVDGAGTQDQSKLRDGSCQNE